MPSIFAGFGKIAKRVPGLIRQDKFRAIVTCTITAWERWVIFPSDYTNRLFLYYKNGSVEESSLESRLKLQQKTQIGLYSQDYESKEQLVKAEKQETPEFLPSGFKKTNSWISVDHKSETKIPDFSIENVSEEDLDGEPLQNNASKTEEESEEDLDGEPLFRFTDAE